ncbi:MULTISPECIES: histidine kinase N-terminal 7TM domain-containing protein [Haloferacaceae]|uniref:histidine kinase n=1 Tax=Halorubrum glutamatedens TaxID=2707018 RepID=A0ABD5QN19_9EURY|nr:histidine kinase N-terminal 7TM domain-containing protein [Halobellus captivus]
MVLLDAVPAWLLSAWPAVPAWPAVGSIAGGIGALGLAWAIRRHRGRPGVDWFLGVFAAQATWCLSYGVGLLVDDPTLRVVLEATTWLGVVWTGIAFLGFALEYTGRSDVVRSRPFAVVVGFGLLSTVGLATNPLHGAFWTGFRFDPVFDVSTVSYALGPWAYLVVAVETVLVASAVFLLVDTLLSYGPLYRRESAAVALSSLPPGFALVAWTLGVGPVPQLQLAPLMFVPHVLLDAYAFNRAEMFDRNPTTSRAAERTAIDDLADPIVALALDHRIVRLNPAAGTLLGVDAAAARDRPLSAFLDVPITVDEDDEITVNTGGRRRTYAVSTSRLTDPNGTHVGYTVVLSDVTERERRRQQLEVLNRVLRHNLRNDAGLVHGYGELLVEQLDDPELVRMADAIERRSGALAALGEKAGTVESLLADADPVEIDVAEAVEEVVDEARERDPDATVDLTIDVGEESENESTARLRPDALRAVVENTVENAIEHHDGAGTEREDGGAWVQVTLRREGAHRFVLVVEDDGSGIPDHEVSAVESGQETALEHGSGLGLWVVEWGAGALGADVAYADREPRGTRVTVRIPVGDGR